MGIFQQSSRFISTIELFSSLLTKGLIYIEDHMNWETILGYGYVIPWSLSAYPPIWHNWRQRSSSAMSLDFVLLNTVGYFYLLLSLWLQLFCWQTEKDNQLTDRPMVSAFDFYYCLHGFTMNLVLVSQVVWGIRLWNFRSSGARMKPVYRRILLGCLLVGALSGGRFLWHHWRFGWVNADTLTLCNTLFLLKISLSLLKYFPQVKHNFDRKSMNGFPIQSVVCDVVGSICSLAQLTVQIARDHGSLTMAAVDANFGRIGIAIVTLLFNFVYISQWLVYGQ